MRLSPLMIAAALAAPLAAAAAPGELDPAFNGQGWIALTGGVNPAADSVCIDAQQRIVVSATRQAVANGPWRGYLLRLSPAGVLDTAFAPQGWSALGTGAVATQMPSLRCAGDRYVATTIEDQAPSWFAVRLDQVPLSGIGATSTSTAGGNLAHSPRVALEALGGGRWLVGASTVASDGWSSNATLQYWTGFGASVSWSGLWTGPAGQPQADYVDTWYDPQGRVFALGRRRDAGTQGMATFVTAFAINGLPLAGFGTSGGTATFDTPLDDYGQRIAPSAFGGQLYVGTSESDPASGATSARVRRLQPTGATDAMFGGPNGVAIANASLGDVIEDNQGRVVVVGIVDDVAFVRRLLANGQPDATFGPNGERRFGFGSLRAMLTGVTIDALGRIVVVGWRQPAQRGGFVVPAAAIAARLQP